MNSRWGFILASILIPIAAIIVGLTNREIRCFFRLESEEVCQANFADVDLIVQNEKFAPIEDAEVRFIFKGAPEVRRTDSNGYSSIRIPSRGDIEIILSKGGFETVRQIINLGNDSDRTRTYQLKELASQPSPDSNPPSPLPSSSPVNSSQIPSSGNSSTPFSASCTLVKGSNSSDYSEDISVGLKPLKPTSRFYLRKNSPRSVTCRITQNSGRFKSTYAIPDNSDLSQVRISFYLDGKSVESLDLARGEAKSISLDTTKSTSYAITYEVLASNGGDYVYVLSESN